MGQEGRGRASDLTALLCSRSAHGRNVLLGMGRVLARLGWRVR